MHHADDVLRKMDEDKKGENKNKKETPTNVCLSTNHPISSKFISYITNHTRTASECDFIHQTLSAFFGRLQDLDTKLR